MILPDGRVVPVVTTNSIGTGAGLILPGPGGGLSTNRLGLIADDLAPCAPRGRPEAEVAREVRGRTRGKFGVERAGSSA